MTTRAKEISELGNTGFLELDANGNLGIGTSGPFSKLDVRGSITSGTSGGTDGSVVLQQRYNNTNALVTLGTMYSSGGWLLGYGINPKNGSTGYVSSFDNFNGKRTALEFTNTAMQIHYAPAQQTTVGSDITGLTTPFYFDLDEVKFGINTDQPSATLHVAGGVRFVTDSTSGGLKNYFSNTGTGGQDYWIMSTNNSNGSLLGGKFAIGTDAISGNNAAQTRLVIDSNGNVGIGQIDPKTKLSLNGVHDSPDETNRILNWYGSDTELGNGQISISVVNSSSDINQPRHVGLALANDNFTTNTYSPAITFGGLAPGSSGTGTYMNGAAAIASRNTTSTSDANFIGGDLHFFTKSNSTSAGRTLSSKMVVTNQGAIQLATHGTHTTIGSYDDERDPYGWNNITTNSHADVLWGLNLRLIGGGSGHDLEVVSSHGSINAAGIKFTGNGHQTGANNILFYAKSSNGTAGNVISPTSYEAIITAGGDFIAKSGGAGRVIRLDGMLAGGSHYIELSGNLPGYSAGQYNCLKTSMNDLHFAAGNTYTGYISYNGGFTDVSDVSLKENIVSIDNALDKVTQLDGRYFNWISEDQGNDRQMGFIAQEVEHVIPEVVTTSEPGVKGVSYGKVTALLVNAIKEQQAIIDNLTARLDALESN